MIDINQVTKILMGLMVVIAVMFIVAFLFKRFKESNYLSNKGINIIGNLFLGNKERLVLIDIEGQRALLGVTAHAIQTLLILNSSVDNQDNFAKNNDLNQFRKILRRQQEKVV